MPMDMCPDPNMGRNEIFWELAHRICHAAETVGVIGIDGVARMAASLPQIANDTGFLASVFRLLRLLNCSAIIETHGSSQLAQQVQHGSDVTLSISEIPVERGSIRVLAMSTADTRLSLQSLRPELRFYPLEKQNLSEKVQSPEEDALWPIRAELVSKSLHAWVISARNEARRPDVRLLLPCGSPSERTHAEQLLFMTGHIAGHRHAKLLPIVSGPRTKDDGIEKLARGEGVIDRYYVWRMIASMATQMREDLTIVACEEHVLGVDSYGKTNASYSEKVLENLEPLGTVADWESPALFGDEWQRLLVNPVVYRDQVVAIPYMLDIGCLVFNPDVIGKAFDYQIVTGQSTRGAGVRDILSWDTISQLEQRPSPSGQLELPNSAPTASPGVFSFNYDGRESRISLFLEYLEEHDCFPKPGDFPAEARHHLAKLNALVRGARSVSADGGKFFKAEGSIKVRRDWYSNLSNLGGHNYLNLRTNGGVEIAKVPGKRMLCVIRYFVIPKGCACKDLGIDLIREFVREEHALERASSLVGLSPYVDHYARGSIMFPPWLHKNLLFSNKKAFHDNCLLRGDCCANYLQRYSQLAELIGDVMFNLRGDEITAIDKKFSEFFMVADPPEPGKVG
jgi:hypothetical protein